MKTLYKLHFDCRRAGSLNGLFIADDADMQKLVESGNDVYFGEVLGKHSDVFGPIEKEDYTEITKDPAIIKIVEDYGLEFGYNPFDYVE